jgi:valyl-tRNA synthetase
MNDKIIKICEQKFIYLNYSNKTKDNYLSHIKKFLETIGDKQVCHLSSKDFQKYLDSYKFKFAGESIYHFIWDELANNYLEKIKDRKDIESILTLDHAFRDSLKLISPFMPFITEEIWKYIKKENDDMLMVTRWE